MTRLNPGDIVWIVRKSQMTFAKPDTVAVVHSVFIGEDNREYAVVKFNEKVGFTDKEAITYDLYPYTAIWDSPQGESGFTKLMKEDKEFAKEFWVGTGIYDEDGNLTDTYK